jgi:hypothetical protein
MFLWCGLEKLPKYEMEQVWISFVNGGLGNLPRGTKHDVASNSADLTYVKSRVAGVNVSELSRNKQLYTLVLYPSW